jgi:hypothetical protein
LAIAYRDCSELRIFWRRALDGFIA